MIPVRSQTWGSQSSAYLQVSSFDLNGGGRSANVAPGASLNARVSYQFWDNGNPTAIWQIWIIFASGNAVACIWSGVPGRQPGVSRTDSGSFSAPGSAGTYSVSLMPIALYSCNQLASTPRQSWPPSVAVGQVTVQATSQATSLTINVNPPSAGSWSHTPVTTSGRLTGANGNGVAQKAITITFYNPNPVSVATHTDVNGQYSYTWDVNLPGGTYTITASFAGDSSYNPSQASGTLLVVAQPPTTQTSVTVTFTIHVQDVNSGSAIAGASVWFDGSFMGSTDSNGNTAVRTTFPPANHNYRVSANGYQDASGPVTIGANSGGTFTVRLQRSGPTQTRVTFSVQVVDLVSGSPVSGASIWLDGSFAGSTDSNGGLGLSTTYPPADHSYRVSASGYQDESGTWTIGSNSGGYFTVRLNRATTTTISSTSSRSATPFAPLQVSISGSSTSENVPLTVTFSSSVSGGAPPYSYRWIFGDGSTDSSSNPIHTYSQAGRYAVVLVVSDSVGGSATSNTITISATNPIAPLQVTIYANSQSGQAPLTVAFGNSVSGGVPPYTYLWNFGDGYTNTDAKLSHGYAQAGTYTVTLMVKDSSGQTATSNSITITVSPQPVSIPGCPNPKNLGDITHATERGSQWVDLGAVGWPWGPSSICVAFSIGPLSIFAPNGGYADLVLTGDSPGGWNTGGGWISVDIYDRDSAQRLTGASGYAGWATPLWNTHLYVHNVPFPRELVMKVTATSSLNLHLVMWPQYAGTTRDMISGILALHALHPVHTKIPDNIPVTEY